MIQKLKELYDRCFHKSDVSRLIYNFVISVAIIALLIIVLIESAMNYEKDGLLVMAALGLYLLVMLILANMYPAKLKLFSSFITIPLNLLVFPFMFLGAEGGGIRSGMPLWMAMGILMLFMTADGIWFIVQLTLTVLMDAFIILYSYLSPETIKTVDSEFYYYEDNLIALCVVSLSMGCMIRYQRAVMRHQTQKIEASLEQAQIEKKRAQKVSESKNKLMASLSYDVRTPLNAIAGLADMAQHHVEEPQKVQECLRRINQSAWQVLELMNHILDISEFEDIDYFDIDEMIKNYGSDRFYRDEENMLVLRAEDKRLLVVEDNEINMDIVNSILERTNAKVTNVWNAEDAISLIEESPEFAYDLILMDIQLPGMDGYSAVRTIRSMNREDALHTPILAMTADVLVQDVEKALKSGMNAHIAKPIIVEELYTKLYYYLYIVPKNRVGKTQEKGMTKS